MAKQRMIHTRFWSDPYIQELDLDTKLLYLYFLTNEHTSICGIYEVSLKTIMFESGIQNDSLRQALNRLLEDGKVKFYKDWIQLVNFSKYQNTNPSIKTGIEREIAEIPQEILDNIQAGDRLGTGCIGGGLLKLKLKLKPEPELEDSEISKEISSPTPKQECEIFFSEEEELKQKVLTWLVSEGMDDAHASQELTKFISYWTELTPNGKKQRWQIQKTFEVKRRLTTWIQNTSKFSLSPPKRGGLTI